MGDGYTKFIPLTPEDLNSAGHFNYYVRSWVSQQCISDQGQCVYIKNNPLKRNWAKPDDFVRSGCDRLLQSSCSIEPKGDRFNASGYADCGAGFDCSGKEDISPQCKGPQGYRLPGCKGFRSDEEAMIKYCVGGYSNEEAWRKRMLDMLNPDPSSMNPYQPGKEWYQQFPANNSGTVCMRLAFKDPKVLRMIKNELNYSP